MVVVGGEGRGVCGGGRGVWGVGSIVPRVLSTISFC